MSMESEAYAQGEYTTPTIESQKALGATALIFIEAFADTTYLDNPSTYLGKIDETETFDEIETVLEDEDVTPSYANTREDYKLLRRRKESSRNRSNRARKRK